MNRTTSTSALLREPMPQADLATLRVWAEWRRRRVALLELERRSGYGTHTIRRFPRGLHVRHREEMARIAVEIR